MRKNWISKAMLRQVNKLNTDTRFTLVLVIRIIKASFYHFIVLCFIVFISFLIYSRTRISYSENISFDVGAIYGVEMDNIVSQEEIHLDDEFLEYKCANTYSFQVITYLGESERELTDIVKTTNTPYEINYDGAFYTTTLPGGFYETYVNDLYNLTTLPIEEEINEIVVNFGDSVKVDITDKPTYWIRGKSLNEMELFVNGNTRPDVAYRVYDRRHNVYGNLIRLELFKHENEIYSVLYSRPYVIDSSGGICYKME